MLNDKFLEVLKYEGLVSITSFANDEAHVVNTWNSYLKINENNELLIPVFGFRKTESLVDINNRVLLTLGSKEVEGANALGTGFLVQGNARFITDGNDFDIMKEDYKWANRVMVVTIENIKQTV